MEGSAAMTQPAAPGEAPDLLYGETEDDLRATVRDFLSIRCPAASVLTRIESSEPYDLPAWHSLAAELGCSGLLVPEPAGGAGASYREAAVVAEETGRAVAPVPFLGSSVTATTVLLSLMASGAGDSGAAAANGSAAGVTAVAQLLTGLASGSVTAALAVPFETMPFPPTAAAIGFGLN